MTAALWVIAPDVTLRGPAHDVIEASHSSVSGYVTIFVTKSTVGDRTRPHGGSVTALGSSWNMLTPHWRVLCDCVLGGRLASAADPSFAP